LYHKDTLKNTCVNNYTQENEVVPAKVAKTIFGGPVHCNEPSLEKSDWAKVLEHLGIETTNMNTLITVSEYFE